MKHSRKLFGLLFWLVAIAFFGSGLVRGIPATPRFLAACSDLFQFWSGARQTIRLKMPPTFDVAVGDPVFVRDKAEGLRQVGEIRAIMEHGKVIDVRRASATEAEVMLYPTAPRCGSNAQITYFATPDSMAWVLKTLLTPERKQQITQELQTAYDNHRAELFEALRPLVENTIRDSLAIIERDLANAIERRRGEIEALGLKYEEEILRRELMPLLSSEIWPIVQRRSEPVVDRLGVELWERVSLWRFGWRAAYDRSPLPERRLLEQEWERFVREEAMPVLSRHTDDMVDIVRGVIQDASRSEAVRTGVRRSLSHVATDPEFQRIVWSISEEVFIDNPRLHAVMEQNWTGLEAEQAFQLAADRLEPTVRRIADLLFGTFDEGITPEFARVLRTQILGKDRHWFLLEVDQGSTELTPGPTRIDLTVERASDRSVSDPQPEAQGIQP